MAKDYLGLWAERVNMRLSEYVAERDDELRVLFESMRYSLLEGGKRLRPALLLASCEAVNGSPEICLPVACAVELLHTYSLIHDDLPCMDNDEMRRGKPSNHMVFGEAISLLTGDALLTMAFEIMTDSSRCPGIPPERLLWSANVLAAMAGAVGMVGGQAHEFLEEGHELSSEVVLSIHQRKTAALFRACTKIGGIVGGGSPEQIGILDQYGYLIGVAFQIIDDILDLDSDKSGMYKAEGSEQKVIKTTYPGVVGVEEARSKAWKLVQDAKEVLTSLGGVTDILEEFADLVVMRKQ